MKFSDNPEIKEFKNIKDFKNMKLTTKKLRIYSWITLVVITLGSVYFVREMKQNAYMETDLDEYMPKEHPAFKYSDMAEEWFSIKDGILIAIENKSGVFNTGTLSKIKEISVRLQEMSQFEENDIMSLYTADNIVGTEDGMDVQPFVFAATHISHQHQHDGQKVKEPCINAPNQYLFHSHLP